MIDENRRRDDPPKSKSKKKSKGTAHVLDEPIDSTFDAMLESASKSTSFAASSKQKSGRKSITEATSGWSNDITGNDDSGDNTNIPPVIRRSNRRAAEEIIATDIPTIPMDEADNDNPMNMTLQVAVAPVFSANQLASFKEIEKDLSRERTSQHINPKIDIGILYHELHLQEQFNDEDQKLWNWDKIFVEIRNAITNPTIEQ
ncbi:unnamed protein product [Rotaria sordida]|uniref:Intraflagellar transport protein 43 homolog n=1 Tax=Rotaria sordida TaxID=392033 RepID=A0A818NQD8_9BILA|nr:unnamed protein product [Rotaria sordida]CAF3607421.1 unnamed protein product [Rotaria sordida]